MQVEFYNETLEEWYVESVVLDDTSPRIINSNENLALDTIFNEENVNTSSFRNGNGTYRVYAAFRDPEGNVLFIKDMNTEWHLNLMSMNKIKKMYRI